MMTALQRLNERLYLNKVDVTVEQLGRKLYLRSTLPPKPNSDRAKPYQQRIALGIPANSEGFKLAEKEARKVAALNACGDFSWLPYIKNAATGIPSAQKAKDLVKDLEKEYFTKTKRCQRHAGTRPPTTERTWKQEYLTVFKHLEKSIVVDEAALRQLILTTEPNTRTRRRYVLACSKLADFAKLNHDLRSLIGSYSPKRVSPRDLPSDELIARSRSQFVDPAWQWAYRMMATYGLRNHEIFFIDFQEAPIARVTKGKTGERIVYPFYLEWFEQWELDRVVIPNAKGDTNSDLGACITKAFDHLPFKPYDLRHCWAVRSLEFGMDISLAAAQMGHSVQVHSETYHHWISKDVYQRAYDRLLSNPNRPKASQI
jgi:integrase